MLHGSGRCMASKGLARASSRHQESIEIFHLPSQRCVDPHMLEQLTTWHTGEDREGSREQKEHQAQK